MIDLYHGTHMVASANLVELICALNQFRFESGDEELRLLRQVKDEICYRPPVFSIQSIIELIHYVEGCSLYLEHSEQKTCSDNRFLTTRQMSQALNARPRVILPTLERNLHLDALVDLLADLDELRTILELRGVRDL